MHPKNMQFIQRFPNAENVETDKNPRHTAVNNKMFAYHSTVSNLCLTEIELQLWKKKRK